MTQEHSAAAAASAIHRPNLLALMLDQLRYDALGSKHVAVDGPDGRRAAPLDGRAAAVEINPQIKQISLYE